MANGKVFNSHQDYVPTSDKCFKFAYEFVVHVRPQLNLQTEPVVHLLNMVALELIFPDEKECLEKFLPKQANCFYKDIEKEFFWFHGKQPFTDKLFNILRDYIENSRKGRDNLFSLCTAMTCLGIYADLNGLTSGLSFATFYVQQTIFHELQKYINSHHFGPPEICQLFINSLFQN